jgi:tRNA(Ile)-lysidine synthase
MTKPITGAEAKKLFAPLAPYPHLALAVSGGPDSLALMHLAARWAKARKHGPKLTVLTVDHGLRPDSHKEAEMVQRQAKKLGLKHAILTWERKGAVSTNIQARAREARYALMAAYCHAHDMPALVTAHHLDDQAETFLMRLKRGSGLDGLAAIPERGMWAGITILRPLLDVPKARLIATLDKASIAYATDPSNIDPRFERARMRGDIEALAKLGLTPEALALSARRLRRARAALDRYAQDFLAKHSELSEAGYAFIDAQALAAAPQEIALRALARLIGAVGGGEEPVRLAKLEALHAALATNPDKTHTLGRCRLEPIRGGRLGIFREARAHGLPELSLKPGERALWDNRFRIELGRGEAGPIVVKALGEPGFRELRKRADIAATLPRFARRTLPACWRGGELLGIPALGNAPFVGVDARAIFVNAERDNGLSR